MEIYTTIQKFDFSIFFLIDTFIQQGCNKLIESHSKDKL